MLEGLAAQAALLYRSADLIVSRGCFDGILRLLYCISLYLSPILRIKLEKRGFDGCTFPYHVSRDHQVRWEDAIRIKCPGFRTHDRRWGNAFTLKACRFARRQFP